MNNNIIQVGRCALVILLSVLTVLATAQVKTNKKAVSTEINTTKPIITQQADFQGPIGVVPNYEFVIEDDIMQSKDGDGKGGSGTKNNDDDDNSNTSETNNDVKNPGFTTSSISQIIEEVKIYPIPANAFANIDLGETKVKRLEIINSLGQVVDSQLVNQQFIRLDISNYEAGMYFIQMTTAANQVAVKTILVN